MTLNTRACTVFNFHSHPLTIQYSRRASPVAGGQVEINDVADAYDCADLLEFAICHISTLCSHPRRFAGQHRDRERDATDWTGNLVAAPRVQATEPQAGFHIAQSSYGTELWAAAASFD